MKNCKKIKKQIINRGVLLKEDDVCIEEDASCMSRVLA